MLVTGAPSGCRPGRKLALLAALAAAGLGAADDPAWAEANLRYAEALEVRI